MIIQYIGVQISFLLTLKRFALLAERELSQHGKSDRYIVPQFSVLDQSNPFFGPTCALSDQSQSENNLKLSHRKYACWLSALTLSCFLNT
jgi:hypothetical protein